MWAGGGGYIFWHCISHNFGLVMRGGRGGGGGYMFRLQFPWLIHVCFSRFNISQSNLSNDIFFSSMCYSHELTNIRHTNMNNDIGPINK